MICHTTLFEKILITISSKEYIKPGSVCPALTLQSILLLIAPFRAYPQPGNIYWASKPPLHFCHAYPDIICKQPLSINAFMLKYGCCFISFFPCCYTGWQRPLLTFFTGNGSYSPQNDRGTRWVFATFQPVSPGFRRR